MIVNVDPNTVAPSQDFLKEKTLNFIFECIRNRREYELPPTPIVRKDQAGKLVAIDGHNILAAMTHLGRNVDVHVATSKTDGLIDNSEATKLRNKDLFDKFGESLEERDKTIKSGVSTFHDLVNKYIETMSRYD